MNKIINDSNIISVIVIGYNVEKFIKRCLESIFVQNYPYFEVIFVNDGSKDDTLIIANSFKEKHVNYIVVDKENGGADSARKAGLSNCNGDFVIFIDGDDYIEQNMLVKLFSCFEENDNCDLAISDYFEERKEKKWYVKKSNIIYGEISGEDYLRNILTSDIIHYAVGKLYRKSLFDDIRYDSFPNFRIGEDLLLCVKIGLLNPNVIYIDDAFYRYCYNSDSATRKENIKIIDEHIKVLKCIIEEINNIYNNTLDDYIQYQWYLFAFGYIQSRFSYDFKKNLIDRCREHLKYYKKNPLYKKQRFSLSRLYGRFLLNSYIKFPFIAKYIDAMLKRIIDVARVIGVLKKY